MNRTTKQTLICHPDIKEDIERAVRQLGKEDEIIVLPSSAVPDRTIAYLIPNSLPCLPCGCKNGHCFEKDNPQIPPQRECRQKIKKAPTTTRDG